MPDHLSESPALSPASLFMGDEGQLPGLTILTGRSGSGKTSLCSLLAAQARTRGYVAGGLLSPPVWHADRKVAIDLLDLYTGARRRLAAPRPRNSVGLMTAGWLFDEETLAWGNERLRALPACDLVILDELGPLELQRDQGLLAGVDMIESHASCPIVVAIRPSLLSVAQSRWPWGRVHQVGEGWFRTQAGEGQR